MIRTLIVRNEDLTRGSEDLPLNFIGMSNLQTVPMEEFKRSDMVIYIDEIGQSVLLKNRWNFVPTPNFEIGDIVKPRPGIYLRSGAESYDDAVVVSNNPFILVSRGTDMMWQSTVDKTNFVFSEKADTQTLIDCLNRLL